jgi:plasmid stability protein
MSPETIAIFAIVAAVAAVFSVLAFIFARLGDAEQRGILKQRVSGLEDRQEKLEGKIDEIGKKIDIKFDETNEKIGEMREMIARLFTERKLEKECK